MFEHRARHKEYSMYENEKIKLKNVFFMSQSESVSKCRNSKHSLHAYRHSTQNLQLIINKNNKNDNNKHAINTHSHTHLQLKTCIK